MRAINLLTTTLVSLISAVSFAGGTGGGGVLKGNLAARIGNGSGNIQREAIFHIGQQDGIIKFAYGQLIDNDWKIEKVELPMEVLEIDEAMMDSLNKSRLLKAWAPIEEN